MKTTFTKMMIIAMTMMLGTTTGFAKNTVNNNNKKEVRVEARREMDKHAAARHEMDKRNDKHTVVTVRDMVRHNDRLHHTPVVRNVTIIEYRGLHESAKRCSVCKHNLHKGERHTHIVKVMK